MVAPTIGIIANPASGRDVRRFVSHSTVFDNHEKSAIIRRALLALEAVGITRVAYMPEDDFGIVARAVDALHGQGALLHMRVEPLSMPVTGSGVDSTPAAQLLVEMGRLASSPWVVMARIALSPRGVQRHRLFPFQRAQIMFFRCLRREQLPGWLPDWSLCSTREGTCCDGLHA